MVNTRNSVWWYSCVTDNFFFLCSNNFIQHCVLNQTSSILIRATQHYTVHLRMHSVMWTVLNRFSKATLLGVCLVALCSVRTGWKWLPDTHTSLILQTMQRHKQSVSQFKIICSQPDLTKAVLFVSTNNWSSDISYHLVLNCHLPRHVISVGSF